MTGFVGHPRIALPMGRIAIDHQPGDRTTVLLIHGNSASMALYAPQIAALRRNGYGTLALDLPGHGESDDARDPAETYSFPGYASAIASLIDALAIPRLHVIGWSLGGHIGLELMGRDLRVASLLIFGTPPVRPGPSALAAAFRPSAVMDLAGMEHLSDDDCRAYATAMVGDEPPASLVASVRRTDGRARAFMVRSALDGVGLDAEALVASDERPIAIVHGADDPFVSAEFLDKLTYRNLWTGKILVLPGTGHAAHWQEPDLFNGLMLEFLSRCELDPRQ